jgi:hypothetical protein
MGEGVFYIWCSILGAWVLYMIAFRPEQWRQYCEDTKDRNRKMLGGGIKLGSFMWRAYRRSQK